MSKRGTLLLSHVSLSEFAGASDPQHCRDTESFLERLLPNIYFTDFRFDEVHDSELAETDNTKRFWPSADLPLLRFFAERAQDTPLGFSMRGFIELAHKHRTALMQQTGESIKRIRETLMECRADIAYIEKTRTVRPDDSRTRTMVILGELLRGYFLDEAAPISDGDVVDLLHAAMPVNCCDYVLLDGPWAERVAKMKQRTDKTATKMPIAKCFSRRANGVRAFLSDIESFKLSYN